MLKTKEISNQIFQLIILDCHDKFIKLSCDKSIVHRPYITRISIMPKILQFSYNGIVCITLYIYT